MATLRRPQIEAIAKLYGCSIPYWSGTIYVEPASEEAQAIGEWVFVQNWNIEQWQKAFERVSGKKLTEHWSHEGKNGK